MNQKKQFLGRVSSSFCYGYLKSSESEGEDDEVLKGGSGRESLKCFIYCLDTCAQFRGLHGRKLIST